MHHGRLPSQTIHLAVCAAGICSKEDLGKLANQAKNAVADGGAKAKDAVSKNVEPAKKSMESTTAEVAANFHGRTKGLEQTLVRKLTMRTEPIRELVG